MTALNNESRIRTSIATVSLSGSLESKIDAIAQAGFDGLEIFDNDLIVSPSRPRRVASMIAERGLSVDLFQPFRDLDSADPRTFQRNLVRLERKFDVMDDLGCDLLLMCSSPLPSAACDDGLLAEQLAAAAEKAAQRGKRLAYEALAWGRHVNDYSHAWRIVADVDHPALGTCLDSFHILSRGDDPAGIAEIPGEKIFYLQLADAPAMSMDVLQWSRHYRCFPGQGNFDLTTFVVAVMKSGYRGPWSLEIFNDIFRGSETGRTAADGHRSLLYLQGLVASCPEVDDSRLFLAPPCGPIDRVVSLRIAAGPERTPLLAKTLRCLGFELSAADSDTGLQLYRQGQLAVVVDSTVGTTWTAPGRAAQLPTIAQIGIRSSDPRAWALRSAAFGVDTHSVAMPKEHSGGSTEVVRTDVTGATSIDLRHPDSARQWLDAFDLMPRHSAGHTPILDGVDHVALAVPEDMWDSTMLSLRSVMGMVPGESQDVPDALGPMRSQSLHLTTDAGERLRLTLNRVPDGVGVSRPGGIAHAAFSVADIVHAARALRGAGLAILEIPDNYYDDVEARYDLDAGLLSNLRRYSILYDTDGSGEFFHFYTEVVGEELFFEVVQRTGDYQGYGEVNYAVRLAAQLNRASA